MPATIVGSAKGRSMSALTTRLPGNSSRTSTHAINVPVTALIAATPSDATSVSSSAETASRPVTACHAAARPPSVALTATAASGRRTITLSQSVAIPPPSAPGPAVARARRRRDHRGAYGAAVSASLGSGDSRCFLDLGDRALVGIEELVVELRPAAEVDDREP